MFLGYIKSSYFFFICIKNLTKIKYSLFFCSYSLTIYIFYNNNLIKIILSLNHA